MLLRFFYAPAVKFFDLPVARLKRCNAWLERCKNDVHTPLTTFVVLAINASNVHGESFARHEHSMEIDECRRSTKSR